MKAREIISAGLFGLSLLALVVMPGPAGGAEARWTGELKAGAVLFYEDAFEEVFDEETFAMFRYTLGVSYIRNLELSGSVGGMYLSGEARGKESGEESGEEFDFWIVPLQLSLGYRFDFMKEQLLVPWIYGGVDYWVFGEQSDFHEDVEGDKTGYHAGAGVALRLDPLEPPAAERMENNWGVHDSFITFSVEWAQVGYESDGIDFSNMQYCLGIMFAF